jgi:hypothetical protein
VYASGEINFTEEVDGELIEWLDEAYEKAG